MVLFRCMVFATIIALSITAVSLMYEEYNSEYTDYICFSDSCIHVEVAETYHERALGLMNRTYLCPNCGMIFVYKSLGLHDFWMKNTLIPLDMIWMDDTGKVVYIVEDLQPCIPDGSLSFSCPSYGPMDVSLYVLEVNAGVVDFLGLQVGDEAFINIH